MSRIIKQKVVYKWIQMLYEDLRYRCIELPHQLSATFSKQLGVNSVKRDPELIVSLTTIPERIGKIHICLDSLLRQSLKPDRLILWLSEHKNSDKPLMPKNRLPVALTRLQRRGLEIRWCKDIRSFRKIIPPLRAFPEALVATADDDIFYPRNWLRMLYEAYQQEPQYIHCHRAHLIKYDLSGAVLPYLEWDHFAPGYQGPSLDLFPVGVGGVLYAPRHLHSEVLNEDAFLELCPKADDVWLKSMSLLMNAPCKKVSANSFCIDEIRIPGNRNLCAENLYQNGNDIQIQAVSQRYKTFQKGVVN